MTSAIAANIKTVKSTLIHLISIVAFTALSLLLNINKTYGVQRPEIQLASGYHQGVNIKAFWVSEKLDGVRAYWDGKQLISRQGNVFWAPVWFVEDFPKGVPLDGELWIGRSLFERVSGIVRQKREDNQAWRAVKFMIFDYPSSKAVFSKRIELMKAVAERADSPYLQVIKQVRVGSEQTLNDWLDNVVANGGEGLMLHRGQAIYQARRSPDLMKLKKHADAEAVILEHLPGKGKFIGKLGAMLVRDEHGIVFKIGSGFSNAQRANPPAVGSTITFKYYGKTRNNVPRFASFMRVR